MKKALLIVVAFALACSRESYPPIPHVRKARKPVKRVEETAQAPSTDVGATMPPYQATLLDGKPFDLTAERGKNVVFLNVWATWCGPCRFEIPELEKMHAKYGSRGFEVVGVSVDESGAEAVKPFVKEQPIGYPIALDPSGKIVWRRVGALIGPEAALDAAIEKALATK